MSANSTSLQYSLVCLGFDESKGPPTLQHVVSELTLDAFPYQFPEGSGLFLVNGWHHLPASSSECRITVAGPQGSLTVDQSFSLEPAASSSFQMSLVFLEGICFPAPGRYLVGVWLQDELYSEYPLTVQEARG